MLKPFRIYLAKKRLKSVASLTGKSKGFKLNKLVLLLDEPNKQALKYLERLKPEFGLSEENFNIISCGNSIEIPNDSLAFKLNEIGWDGNLKNEPLKGVIASGPDLVINYAEKGNSEADFLLKVIPASVKAGRYDEKEINLSINDGNQPEVFANELIKYLKTLKGR